MIAALFPIPAAHGQACGLSEAAYYPFRRTTGLLVEPGTPGREALPHDSRGESS